MKPDISYLQGPLFYAAGVTALVVFAVLIYALIKFKRGEQGDDNPEPNLQVELLWTLVPFVMLLFMALPIIKAYYKHHLSEAKTSSSQQERLHDAP